MIAHGALILRLVAYCLLQPGPTLWVVLPVESLHGLAFATCYLAAVDFAASIAPLEFASTSQGTCVLSAFDNVASLVTRDFILGIMNMFFGSLGTTLGSLIGGAIYGAYNGKVLFASNAVALAVSGILFFIFGKQERSTLTQAHRDGEVDIKTQKSEGEMDIPLDTKSDADAAIEDGSGLTSRRAGRLKQFASTFQSSNQDGENKL